MKKIYLDYHLRNYPKMTNQDIIKLVYQAVLGPLHFSQLDYEKALFLIKDELKQQSLENENLYEHIGSNYIRMNIKTYNKYGFDIPLLIEMFNESCTTDYKLEEFRDYLLKCILRWIMKMARNVTSTEEVKMLKRDFTKSNKEYLRKKL